MTPEIRLQEILSQLADDSNHDPDFLLNRFSLIILALEHHCRHGGLSRSDQNRLCSTAELILKGMGIKIGQGRSAKAYTELFRVQEQLSALNGESWLACWQGEMAQYSSFRPEAEELALNLMLSARSYFRRGYGSLAAETFHSVERISEEDNTKIQARSERARCYWLMGDSNQSAKLQQELSGSGLLGEQGKRLLRWRMTLQSIMNQKTPNFRALIQVTQKSDLELLLLTKGYVASSSDRNMIKRFHKTDTILRQHKAMDLKEKLDDGLIVISRFIESLYDQVTPLLQKLDLIGKTINNRHKLTDIEHELILLAVAIRFLVRYSQDGMAQLALAEYRSLSLSMSSGLNFDALGVLRDLDHHRKAKIAEKKIMNLNTTVLQRSFGLSKLMGKVTRATLDHKWRQLLSSAEEKERLLEEEQHKMGDIVCEALMNLRGGLMKVGKL